MTDTTSMTGATGNSDTPKHRYTAALAGEIERRWQDNWQEQGTFHAPNPSGPWAGDDAATVQAMEKFFLQDMFPYPSGDLHMGHAEQYALGDAVARYWRHRGCNVLHPIGWDSFGLPAEQYAVQTGTHPRTTTEQNIERYLGQIRRLGLGHDERRRVATTDVDFYRWTQWIFLQIYNAWYDDAAGKARPISELVDAFAAGEVATADGRAWAELTDAEMMRYNRQIVLRGFDFDGQEALKAASVLVVGLGDAAVARPTFTEEQLTENFQAALEEVLRLKPSTSKGRYILKATMTTTMEIHL